MDNYKYMDICINDFSKICRVCLLPNIVLFDAIELLNFYSKIIGIEVNQDDGLPKNICDSCGIELRKVACFIDKCKENDRFLTAILIQSKKDNSSPSCDAPDYESDAPFSTCGEPTIKLENEACSNNNMEPPEPPFKTETESDKTEYISERNFNCADCGKGFYNKKELIIHMKMHSKRFKRTYLRNNHRKVHTRVKIIGGAKLRYSCSRCDRVLTSHSALSSHMKTHTGEKPYSCKYCGKSFPYVSSLTVHTRLHTGETPFICPICNKGYRSSTSLKKHKEVKHYEMDDVKQERNENDTSSSDLDKRECKICKKVLHKHGFGTHMRIHTIEKKKFVCTFCNKNFQKNSHLERHIRIHTGERPYICKLCGKTFKQDGDLKRHVFIHTGEKQFQCQHCGKQYYTKGSLDTHMMVHTGTKRPVSYECNICMKSFRQCTHFKTHMNSHTGEKPYLCTICGKSFTASGTLKVHTRIHTGETPFVCSYCNKGYNNSSSLKRHVMRNHTGEKPYVCMICHKAFHDSTNLKRHVKRVHSVLEIKQDNEAAECSSVF